MIKPVTLQEVEALSERMHDTYLEVAKRIEWPIRDGMDVPYNELSEHAKDLDRGIARIAIQVVREFDA